MTTSAPFLAPDLALARALPRRSSLVVAIAALAAIILTAGPAGAAPAAAPTEEQRVTVAIERALRKHAPDVHRCFERSLADNLDATGKVDVEVDVGQGGQVTGAKVLAQEAEVPAELSRCVTESARSWRIEGVEAGAAVVLPFSFAGQMNQFVIKAADVPTRGPAGGGQVRKGPFTVKVLVDPVNVRGAQASLTLLTVGPASRVAMHRHPRSAKILYLLKGRARVLGPSGTPPIKADEGTAVFLPEGYPHVIENMGRQAEAVFLQAFSPPGPERVYRDPRNVEARADFEVIRDPRVKAPPGAKPVAVDRQSVRAQNAFGGKVKVQILLDEKATGSAALALSILEMAAGADLPRHSHAGSGELLYVLEGGGKLTVGSEEMPFAAASALYLPSDQPHAAKIGSATTAIQIYAPAGPEQRFRQE